MRAIAVLMVLLYHAKLPVPGGFVGVDVFFVISGFVIAAMLMREWNTHGRVRFGRFYLRRFKRLSPALALVLSVTMVASVFILSPLGTQQDTSRTGVGTVLLAANFVISRITGGYFDLEADTNALLNTWSLSVEEQFYLIFPLILVAGWALARRLHEPNVALMLVSGVAAASLGLALMGAAGYVPPREAWLVGFYSPLTRAWEFAAGALIALLGDRARVTSHRLAAGLGIAGTGLLVASLFLITGALCFPGVVTFVPVFGTVALLLAGGLPGSATQRVLSARPLVHIGDWSYSLYLWHWPLIVFATLMWPTVPYAAPAAALLSFLPAIASYVFVEEPLRSYNPSTRSRLISFIAVTVAIPLVSSAALWQASQHGFWRSAVQSFQKAIFAQPEDCSREGSDARDECLLNAELQGAPIYLVGDSNAGQFSEGLVIAGNELGRPVRSTTTNACPSLDLYFERLTHSGSRNQACRTQVQSTLTTLETSPPGLVIIANIDAYWIEENYAVGLTPETTADREAKMGVLRDGLERTVSRLQSSGHAVLLVQTIPRWIEEDTWRTASCSIWDVTSAKCEQTMSVDAALARQGEVRGVLDSVASVTGASVFDPWPVLCSGGVCSTQGSDHPRYYRDGSHISVVEGLAFAEALEQAVRETQR